jgi:hypothetical protein
MICVAVLSVLPNIILTEVLNITLNPWAMAEVYSTSLLLLGFIFHKFLSQPKKRISKELDQEIIKRERKYTKLIAKSMSASAWTGGAVLMTITIAHIAISGLIFFPSSIDPNSIIQFLSITTLITVPALT